MTAGAATKLTDRLSFGANMSLGSAFLDGPFVGIDAMVPDYAFRGGFGVNYDLSRRHDPGLLLSIATELHVRRRDSVTASRARQLRYHAKHQDVAAAELRLAASPIERCATVVC